MLIRDLDTLYSRKHTEVNQSTDFEVIILLFYSELTEAQVKMLSFTECIVKFLKNGILMIQLGKRDTRVPWDWLGSFQLSWDALATVALVKKWWRCSLRKIPAKRCSPNYRSITLCRSNAWCGNIADWYSRAKCISTVWCRSSTC